MSRREFLDFVLEQMSLLQGLRARGMFGGFGIYSGDLFFALIADDRLFFKTDEENRQAFMDRGLKPFEYRASDGKAMSMAYYEAPPEAYDDRDAMREWAQRSIAAAARSAARKRPRPARQAAASKTANKTSRQRVSATAARKKP